MQAVDQTKQSQYQFPALTSESQTNLQTSQASLQRSQSPQNQGTHIGQVGQNPQQSGQLFQATSSTSIASLAGIPPASTKKGRFSITESHSGGSVEGTPASKVLVTSPGEIGSFTDMSVPTG
ncbi:hypothetical protein HK096_000540, partial [Nowakowskiella sp. JEL0078]